MTPGEFDLIERLLARLGDSAATTILVPPGDDAAAWTMPPQAAAVASVDTLVQGTHWRPDTMGYADVGWRAAATALSDLAAMGAHADLLLVACVLGPSLAAEDLDAVASGLAEACSEHGVRIAGGDTARGATTSITVTALGYALPRAGREPAPLLLRSGARAGDAIAVSGRPGAAAAGLALLDAGGALDPAARPLLAAHRRPRARLELGRRALAAGARGAVDVSDGLVQDLGHLARASGVSVALELASLPLHPAATGLLGEQRARDLALGGGDDYELLLAGDAPALGRLSAPGLEVTLIGRALPPSTGAPCGTVRVLDERGEAYEPPSAGWDHLRSAAGAPGR